MPGEMRDGLPFSQSNQYATQARIKEDDGFEELSRQTRIAGDPGDSGLSKASSVWGMYSSYSMRLKQPVCVAPDSRAANLRAQWKEDRVWSV